MKWLLTTLVTVGVSTVLGVLRPWKEIGDSTVEVGSQSVGLLIGLIIWVLLPMIAGWMFLRRNLFPITRIFLQVFVAGLLFVWGLGAVVTVFDASFDGNLGLLFWPALEWIGLLGIFTVWALEGASRKNKRAESGPGE